MMYNKDLIDYIKSVLGVEPLIWNAKISSASHRYYINVPKSYGCVYHRTEGIVIFIPIKMRQIGGVD